MKTIFLIGPSGVGKTTLTKELLKQLESVTVVELDEEVKKQFRDVYCRAHENWERFWDASMSCVQNLQAQSSGKYLVIDVGAGSLQSGRALDFFKNQETVFVSDTPENTLKKVQSRPGNAWAGRSLADFKAVEFSSARQDIYSAGRHRIDLSGRSTTDATTDLISILKN